MPGLRAHVNPKWKESSSSAKSTMWREKKNVGEMPVNVNEPPALPWQEDEMNSTGTWHLGC